MIYKVSKRMEISAAHKLDLPYESKCVNLHGHNYIVYVSCVASELNDEGMVADFAQIKKLIHERLDHHYLNDILNCNPTAENMAEWIGREVNEYLKSSNKYCCCFKVSVQESEGNIGEALLPITSFSVLDEVRSPIRTYIWE